VVAAAVRVSFNVPVCSAAVHQRFNGRVLVGCVYRRAAEGRGAGERGQEGKEQRERGPGGRGSGGRGSGGRGAGVRGVRGVSRSKRSSGGAIGGARGAAAPLIAVLLCMAPPCTKW